VARDVLAQVDVETAGHHVATRVLSAEPTARVDEVIARLRGGELDSVDPIYVVDTEGKLLGGIPLLDLLRAPDQRPVGELVDIAVPRVASHHDQEYVAAEALEHGATCVAVVDDQGRLLGAVPPRTLLQILRREHVEDLHRLAGILRENGWAQGALEASPVRRARHRLPWLVVGLGGSMLAAFVMSRFEHALEDHLAIAFFVPAIVYLADAIGTQTEAIVVRGLSLSRLSLRHLLADEIRTGLIIGLTLGALALPLVALVFGEPRLAIAVAASIVVAGALATSIGLLLPWLFQRAGSDPALGSGPVATILQDVLSLLIYFAIVSIVVR
jgi:magnesium transporter